MAAITTAAAGNASATGTWVGGVVPGPNDTVTITKAVAVDVNMSWGLTAFTTGGTPAILLSTGGSLTINSGVTLTVSGDIKHAADSIVTMSPGSTLNFATPSGQQAVWNFAGGNYNAYLVANGTSVARCTVKTSSGTNTIMALGGYHNMGIITASYTDFSNFGTSSVYGLQTLVDYTNNASISITNCTFSGCNYKVTMGSDNAWDGTLTFTGNKFISSTAYTSSGFQACVNISSNTTASTGVRTWTSNYFDKTVLDSSSGRAGNWQYNIFVDGILSVGTVFAYWPQYDSNVHCHLTVSAVKLPTVAMTNNYAINNKNTTNPDMWSFADGTDILIDSNLFDCPLNTGAGDMLTTPSNTAAAHTITIKRNIALPNGSGVGCGALLSASLMAAGHQTVYVFEHNTVCNNGNDIGACSYGSHSGGSATTVGEIASCRSNISWNTGTPAKTTGMLNALNDGSGASVATDDITVAGYNCIYGGNSGDVINCAGDTTHYSQTGYNWTTIQIHISTAGPLPNSQIGTGDIAVNPAFVDTTRRLQTWGQNVVNMNGDGTLPTISTALNWLFDHGPATQIPAMMSWVRAGYVPTNPALLSTYPGDTSSTDAAGNNWLGSQWMGAMKGPTGGASLVDGGLIGHPLISGGLVS